MYAPALMAIALAIFGLDAAQGGVPLFERPRGDTTQPHAAVARIVVDDGSGYSFGSGVLVDVRGRFGLVVTNWHVVRDARGTIEVLFGDGFSSQARALKVDEDWDLAALVIWRPTALPAAISQRAPARGDQLTICGFGPGVYRSATGRCTQYYSPGPHLPEHVVELDVQARQGDSGGPIFNDRGEVAGILFGASRGTTLGSFGGRVKAFLETLAPDIGSVEAGPLAASRGASPTDGLAKSEGAAGQKLDPEGRFASEGAFAPLARDAMRSIESMDRQNPEPRASKHPAVSPPQTAPGLLASHDVDRGHSRTADMSVGWIQIVRNGLAAIGAIAVVRRLLRLVV